MAVIATLPCGREQVGSGYLVEGRQVLTAEHCTRDRETGAAPLRLRVIRASDGASVEVEDLEATTELDVAVLQLAHPPWEPDLPLPAFARVDRTRSGVLSDCSAIGFPLFQRDPDLRSRRHAELHGTIYQTDESETGRLLMRERLLTSLGHEDHGTGAGTGPAGSVWGGLSGALVFHVGRALGVVVEHHPRQGNAAVQLVAFDTIQKWAETDETVRGVSEALKLAPPDHLICVTAEPVAPLVGLVDLIDPMSGDLPAVCDLDPYRLGTTSSDYGSPGSYGDRDPYVPRTQGDADTQLKAALEPARMVLVVGPSKVGKTRTTFEAIRARWEQAHLVAPLPESLVTLAAHPRLCATRDPLVVWLDDLDRFLTTAEALTPAVLTALLARSGHTVVVASMRQEARDRLRAATGEFNRDTRSLLEAATPIELRSTSEDPNEQAAARAAYPDQRLEGSGLAERLGYAPELLSAYRDSKAANPVRYTVVRTAIDWARTGLSRPIPETDLLEISSAVLSEEHPELDTTPEAITTAIKEARRPLGSSPGSALLLTVRLPGGPGQGDQIRGYRAYDYLAAADDGQTGYTRPLPERSWQDALTHADGEDVFAVSVAAYQRDNLPVSVRGFERSAKAGDTRAMFNLGLLLSGLELPDLLRARSWYEQAAEAGHTDAMNNLGLLLSGLKPPDLLRARSWYEQAADAGDTDAMFNLGDLLSEQWEPPDLRGARQRYEQAAEGGHTDAMVNLGNLLADRWEPPDLPGARQWFEQAAEAGHTGAMFNLGLFLSEQWAPPDLPSARQWYEQAANAHYTDAMFNLANLLADRWEPPDLPSARHWYEQAAEAGHTGAMFNLALLLSEQWEPPDLLGARHWYEQAADAGDTDAMFNLALLLSGLELPDLLGARHWYEQAADAGDTDAMFNLANLLADRWEPPDLPSTRHWYEQAAEAGHTDAMVTLAPVLAVEGDTNKSRSLLQQAAQAGSAGASAYADALSDDPRVQTQSRSALGNRGEVGDTAALDFLGVLEWRNGAPDDARAVWARSRDAGDKVARILLWMTT
ncbi:bifunctional trypsin-like peptidase domain-containing/SEL1-like repeat protein [Streptomyces sp. NPDC023998]|uniref:bifunctional trypsin-like peptidase domain-containing/SEL1-like repeat protein n=1 Tax=Streptomyces sp. NPDC023998 TaxID=3154597 RepID=UPI0033D685BE